MKRIYPLVRRKHFHRGCGSIDLEMILDDGDHEPLECKCLISLLDLIFVDFIF